MPPAPLYLEDLHVGQTFVSEPVTLTTEQIKAFAREYDPQPFHLDEDAARAAEPMPDPREARA